MPKTFWKSRCPYFPSFKFFLSILGGVIKYKSQNFKNQTPHNRGVVWGGAVLSHFALKCIKKGYRVSINHYSCFHKKKFSFLRWSLLGASCIKYIYTIIPSVFSPYRVYKRNWLKFEIYDLIQSIFWDTLYGENTIQISIYVFGTKGSPKAQPNKEKLFLESNYNA